jgi:hypothetical protein
MTQRELAKQLDLSIGYVSKLCQEGMPKDLVQARDWLKARKAGRLRKLPAPPAKPAPAQLSPVQMQAVTALANGSLDYALAQHILIIDLARDALMAAISGNDPAQAKLQTAYNGSLKGLVFLQDKEKARALEARELIKLSEAQAFIAKWTAKVVQKLDKLPLECAEGCNPDRPETAIKSLTKWAIEVRSDLAKETL